MCRYYIETYHNPTGCNFIRKPAKNIKYVGTSILKTKMKIMQDSQEIHKMKQTTLTVLHLILNMLEKRINKRGSVATAAVSFNSYFNNILKKLKSSTDSPNILTLKKGKYFFGLKFS